MNKLLLTTCTGILLSFAGFTQSDSNFDTSELTWFGIDYTQCYFLTPIDFPSRTGLMDKLDDWNDLVLYEREKYIEKTLKGKKVDFYIDAVESRNAAIEIKNRITEDKTKVQHLKPDQIPGIISGYTIAGEYEGTGLVLIAESYDKPNEVGYYYAVFFDIPSKKVLSSERLEGKAGGFGLRNYWAKSYYTVLKEVGKNIQD